MQFKVQIVGGQIIFSKGFDAFVGKQKDNNYTIEIKKFVSIRTNKQNNSIHKYCDDVANSLNENGITAHQIFSESVEGFWTMEMIKELWKKIQYAMYRTKSTKKLLKLGQIGKIYQILHKLFAEKSGGLVDIPFPDEKNKNGH